MELDGAVEGISFVVIWRRCLQHYMYNTSTPFYQSHKNTPDVRQCR